MEKVQREAIDAFIKRCEPDGTILAILLTGSIAHGFARPDSDIDLAIVVDEAEYRRRLAANKVAFSVWDICDYPGGYIDCKVVSVEFLNTVAARGSDPARFAFKDAVILVSRLGGLSELLAAATRFPAEEAETRRRRFAAQILAWKWYFGEAEKKRNTYLRQLAVQKLVLFSCRLVLNENALLYPYHKWLLEVVKAAGRKPADFDAALDDLLTAPSAALVERHCANALAFAGLDAKTLDWPNLFLLDSEWNWTDHEAPIDDV